jgi:hypothetical protein
VTPAKPENPIPAGRDYDADEVHRLIEEAQLFIEASHACADKLREQKASNLRL